MCSLPWQLPSCFLHVNIAVRPHLESGSAHLDSGPAFPETVFNPRNTLLARTHDHESGDLDLIWNHPRASDPLAMEFCFLSRKIRAYVYAKLNTYTCTVSFNHIQGKAGLPVAETRGWRAESRGLAQYSTVSESQSLTLDAILGSASSPSILTWGREAF